MELGPRRPRQDPPGPRPAAGRPRGHPGGLSVTGHDYAAELAGVDETIAAIRAALRESGAGHPDHGTLRYNLGVCEMVRFSIRGERGDLDAGISDLEAAVATIPPGHPERPMALAT